MKIAIVGWTGLNLWWMHKFISLPKTSIKEFWETAKYMGIARKGICFDVDTPQDLELLRAAYAYGIQHFK